MDHFIIIYYSKKQENGFTEKKNICTNNKFFELS